MMKIFNIESYLISDYLLVSCLLNGETLSWEESKIKILSSRAANHVSNVRKIIGNFNCIKNEAVNTMDSYYEQYKLNKEFIQEFQDLKMQYESNVKFIKRLNKKMEKISSCRKEIK